MISFETKWSMRQITLDTLSYICCTTTFILALISIRAYDFYERGLSIYTGYKFVAKPDLHYILYAFWNLSVSPLLIYIPLTILVDALLRRHVMRILD